MVDLCSHLRVTVTGNWTVQPKAGYKFAFQDINWTVTSKEQQKNNHVWCSIWYGVQRLKIFKANFEEKKTTANAEWLPLYWSSTNAIIPVLLSKGISPFTDLTEMKSFGIACILAVKCKGCNYVHTMNTSLRLQTSNHKINRFAVNVGSVWGSMVTGNGPSHLNELLGTN